MIADAEAFAESLRDQARASSDAHLAQLYQEASALIEAGIQEVKEDHEKWRAKLRIPWSANLVTQGYLLRDDIHLPQTTEEWSKERIWATFKEGKIEHRTLCARVACWFEGLGIPWSVGKARHYGAGMSDIAAADGSIVAECGRCSYPDKILHGANSGAIVLHVPYHFGDSFPSEEVWPSDEGQPRCLYRSPTTPLPEKVFPGLLRAHSLDKAPS